MSYFIYVVAHVRPEGLSGPVKIGITNNPASRLSSLQTGSPNKITFAHLFQVKEKDAARHFERTAHSLWEECCLSGEWFDTDPASVVDVIAADLELGIISAAAKQRMDFAGLKAALVWSGVTSGKKLVSTEMYLRAWEHQAA